MLLSKEVKKKISQKVKVINRAPKKEVFRRVHKDYITLNTTEDDQIMYTAENKCTIMGFEYRIFMISYEGTPSEAKRECRWIMYTTPHSTISPFADDADSDVDAQVMDDGWLAIPDQAGVSEIYYKKSRQKRKLSKGDYFVLTVVGSDVDVKCFVYAEVIYYIGE